MAAIPHPRDSPRSPERRARSAVVGPPVAAAAPRTPLGSIQSGVAREIAPLLRELGANAALVIQAAGLRPACLGDPEAVIPLAAFCDLISRAGVHTGCPHFGLLLGHRVKVSALGLIGPLMLHSERVGDALRHLIRHVEIHGMGATTTLTTKGDAALWTCVVYEPGTACADQIADAAAAAAANVMRALCGADWAPTEVLLPRAVPADEALYRRLFRAPVRYNREVAALVFPALQLGQPIPGADAVLLQVLKDRLGEQRSRPAPDLTAQLRQLLRTELLQGDCSVDRIAGLCSPCIGGRWPAA